MPSPLGHAFGGIAVAWLADLVPRSRAHRPAWDRESFFARAGGPFTLVCAALAAAPDLDLSFVMHRTATHSVTAVALVTIVAMLVTGKVTRRSRQSPVTSCQSKSVADGLETGDRGLETTVVRVALTCGAAYASHLLLDWLGIDNNPPRGIQVFWPFSDQWFISGLDLFIQTERRRFFTWGSVRTNLLAMAWETLVLVPLLAAIWLVRVKALAGLPAELPRGDHTP